jgi:hypothetical protein
MANLLTTAQVAERLGRSVSYVNAAAAAGRLNVEVQVPGATGARLYHPAEVDRFADTIDAAPTEASA